MGKAAPPFLYDPPSMYPKSAQVANFNPKTVTESSWAPKPRPPKGDGPFVNFNRHPDSYMVIPSGRKLTQNFSPNVKRNIKFIRLFQLGIRVLSLIGVMGLLFCVICIQKTSMTVACMIRIGPAISALHILYGIYHLCRSSSGRPPGSTTSYMLFAAVLDAGLVPFFGFIAYISKIEHLDGRYGWTTLLEGKEVANKIFYSTFLLSTTVGGMHLVSLIIDLYLAVVFRKITKMPPDMNPLEDNLTSRRHKSATSAGSNKHLSQSTVDSRDSGFFEVSVPQPRTVPFMHTRGTSSVSGMTSQSHGEIANEAPYRSGHARRYSRADLPSQQQRQMEQTNRPKTPITRTTAKRRGTGPSRPQSAIFNAADFDSELSRGRKVHNDGDDDNWHVFSSRSPSPDLRGREAALLRSRSVSPDIGDEQMHQTEWEDPFDDSGLNGRSGTVRRHPPAYTAVDGADEGDFDDVFDDKNIQSYHSGMEGRFYSNNDNAHVYADEMDDGLDLPVNPLGMNPPTPQPMTQGPDSQHNAKETSVLADLPNPPSGNGNLTPRKTRASGNISRAYGELGKNTPSPARRQGTSSENATTPGSKKKLSSRWRRKSGKGSVYESLQLEDDGADTENGTLLNSLDGDHKGRVVSNSGMDLGLELGSNSPNYGSYLAGLGVGRRRDVSGKVAEEGRGTMAQDENGTPSKNTDLRNSKNTTAAGWARWAGL